MKILVIFLVMACSASLILSRVQTKHSKHNQFFPQSSQRGGFGGYRQSQTFLQQRCEAQCQAENVQCPMENKMHQFEQKHQNNMNSLQNKAFGNIGLRFQDIVEVEQENCQISQAICKCECITEVYGIFASQQLQAANCQQSCKDECNFESKLCNQNNQLRQAQLQKLQGLNKQNQPTTTGRTNMLQTGMFGSPFSIYGSHMMGLQQDIENCKWEQQSCNHSCSIDFPVWQTTNTANTANNRGVV